MNDTARVRINEHRLMRAGTLAEVSPVESARMVALRDQERLYRSRVVRHAVVHVGVFIFSFVFTAGVALIGMLLWVRPDNLFALVLLAILCGVVFVSTFAGIRLFILHHLLDEYPDKEEDPGFLHHFSKSIAYGFLALVFAFLLTGILIHRATTHPII